MPLLPTTPTPIRSLCGAYAEARDAMKIFAP
jgi:hypothetical protein